MAKRRNKEKSKVARNLLSGHEDSKGLTWLPVGGVGPCRVTNTILGKSGRGVTWARHDELDCTPCLIDFSFEPKAQSEHGMAILTCDPSSGGLRQEDPEGQEY